MSVYSNILKRSYFEAARAKRYRILRIRVAVLRLTRIVFARTLSSHDPTGTSSDARRTGGIEIFAETVLGNLQELRWVLQDSAG